MANKKINDIEQKEAETKAERLLLGLIAKKAKDLNYGEVILKLEFRKGELKRAIFKQRDDGFAIDNGE